MGANVFRLEKEMFYQARNVLTLRIHVLAKQVRVSALENIIHYDYSCHLSAKNERPNTFLENAICL